METLLSKKIVPWRDPFGTGFDIPIEPSPLLLLDLPLFFNTPEHSVLAGGPGIRSVQLHRCAPLALRLFDKEDKPVDIDVNRLSLSVHPVESNVAPHLTACPVKLESYGRTRYPCRSLSPHIPSFNLPFRTCDRLPCRWFAQFSYPHHVPTKRTVHQRWRTRVDQNFRPR